MFTGGRVEISDFTECITNSVVNSETFCLLSYFDFFNFCSLIVLIQNAIYIFSGSMRPPGLFSLS